MQSTLYSLLPLFSYICEDPYLNSFKEEEEFLADYRSISKSTAYELIDRLKIKSVSTHSELYGGQHPGRQVIRFDRVIAAEFKDKNRHESAKECFLLFTQMY